MTLPNLWLFIISILFLLIAVLLVYQGKHTQALLLLLITGLAIRLFAAHLDPFLHVYDERYHAIVARNMMNNPFKPYFRLPVIPYDYTYWGGNYIWLHKQPLFLWQMALSMKILGVNEYTIRYPDVLMGTITVSLVYRIALQLTKDKTTSFIAAAFMCFSNYQLELISGNKGMDHNDVAFAFYILCSFWAYAEYLESGKWKWVVLIGVFAGCAILNKWMVGLLVFSTWGINILLDLKNGSARKETLPFIIALIVCVIVFLPWQLYIIHTFPVEAKYEYAENIKHIPEAVGGAAGNESYYLARLELYFGYAFPLFLAGLIIIFFAKDYCRKMIVLIVSAILIPFTFFTFIVHTKVDSFMFIVVPFGFILMAVALTKSLTYFKKSIPFQLVCTCITTFLVLNYFQIADVRNPNSYERERRVHNTNIYKNLEKTLPRGISVVMNVPAEESADCMFYNKGISAYHYCLQKHELEIIKKQKIPIAVFEEHPGYAIPQYIKNYSLTYIIKMPLK